MFWQHCGLVAGSPSTALSWLDLEACRPKCERPLALVVPVRFARAFEQRPFAPVQQRSAGLALRPLAALQQPRSELAKQRQHCVRSQLARLWLQQLQHCAQLTDVAPRHRQRLHWQCVRDEVQAEPLATVQPTDGVLLGVLLARVQQRLQALVDPSLAQAQATDQPVLAPAFAGRHGREFRRWVG